MARSAARQSLVIVGGGMSAYKLIELLTEMRGGEQYAITLIAEEPRLPYDRVHLTEYFTGRDASKIELAPRKWYADRKVTTRLREKAVVLDTANQTVVTQSGWPIHYDKLVLATGSYPFVPPVPGRDLPGVHVYRTIEDLDGILQQARNAKDAAVIGGGLLGLEAARALQDLGARTYTIEFGSRLMARQLDDTAGHLLRRKVEGMGVRILTNRNTQRIEQAGKRLRLVFGETDTLEVDTLVFSAGVRPRDDLARHGGLQLAERGGIVVDDQMQTSAANVLAIGECASHKGMVYGLVAPCYQMAEVAARTLVGQAAGYTGSDLSTKLKLMGVEVATVGDPVPLTQVRDDNLISVIVHDEIQETYQRLLIEKSTRVLRGAMLVGNADAYAKLVSAYRSGSALPEQPVSLFVSGAAPDSGGADALICTCNNVTRGAICTAVSDGCATLGEITQCTKAGAGCGGCKPQVSDILYQELARLGKSVKKTICEHFAFSRQELLDIVKVKRLKTYDEVLAACGTGAGCEVCQPLVASLLAVTNAETAAIQQSIQDTNDRFLANIQRGGTYSVVPRIPGGEITPRQMIVLGQVAEDYDLYLKITGGQRIDLFGARVDQLPEIWERLIAAGFESGHAYAKGMRTVKSCVGSTWCRFGVLDSTGFAIRLEHRYKGIRSPHKLKCAVSGCIRECAEARGKDFGIIATEAGWNLYVGGNGGASPRHADLLASGLDDDTCVRYIDRFLMYYIRTGDPLTRTSKWLESLEGGLEQLRAVVVDDSLGIAATLESEMQAMVDGYACEWKQVVQSPERRAGYRAFVNTPQADSGISFVTQRAQKRPASGGGFVELQRLGTSFEDRAPQAGGGEL